MHAKIKANWIIRTFATAIKPERSRPARPHLERSRPWIDIIDREQHVGIGHHPAKWGRQPMPCLDEDMTNIKFKSIVSFYLSHMLRVLISITLSVSREEGRENETNLSHSPLHALMLIVGHFGPQKSIATHVGRRAQPRAGPDRPSLRYLLVPKIKRFGIITLYFYQDGDHHVIPPECRTPGNSRRGLDEVLPSACDLVFWQRGQVDKDMIL